MCLAADPGVPSFILARSHTSGETDLKIISTAILLPSADSRRIVVSYKRKYVHEVLVNCLVKLTQEKIVVRLTDHPYMTITASNQSKTIITFSSAYHGENICKVSKCLVKTVGEVTCDYKLSIIKHFVELE